MTSPWEPARVVRVSVSAGAEAVEVAVGVVRLPGRFLRMVEDAEALLARADTLMGHAERHINQVEDMVGVLTRLDRLTPDVAELLRRTEEVRRAVLTIPGMGMIWRRGGQPSPAAEADAVLREP